MTKLITAAPDREPSAFVKFRTIQSVPAFRRPSRGRGIARRTLHEAAHPSRAVGASLQHGADGVLNLRRGDGTAHSLCVLRRGRRLGLRHDALRSLDPGLRDGGALSVGGLVGCSPVGDL